MDTGLILAVFTAFTVAFSAVLIRRGAAQAGESFTATAISIFMGIPFFIVTLYITNEWSIVWSISGRALVLFGVAGVLHFVVGRALVYNALRIIGTNKTSPFVQTNIFYAVIIGVLLLKEPLTILLIPGVLCIFTGTVLISTERKSVADAGQKGLFGAEVTGIINALGGAICWGISPIILKIAIEEAGSPFVGAFVSYAAASVVEALLLFRKQNREQFSHLALVPSLVTLVAGGFMASAGQLLRYMSLSYSPASIVTPIVATSGLFAIILSFMINRHIEVFTLRVVLGMTATVAGVFLLFQ